MLGCSCRPSSRTPAIRRLPAFQPRRSRIGRQGKGFGRFAALARGCRAWLGTTGARRVPGRRHRSAACRGRYPGRAEPCSAALAGRVRVRRPSTACARFNLGKAASVGWGKASGGLAALARGCRAWLGTTGARRVPGRRHRSAACRGRHPGRAEPCSAALAGRVRVRRPSDVCPRFNLGKAASVDRGRLRAVCRAGARLPSMARHYRCASGCPGDGTARLLVAEGTRVEPSHARLLLPAEFAYAGHPTCARVSASAKPRRSAGERFRAGLPRWRAGAEHGSALPVRVGVPGRRRRSVPGRGQAPG